MISRNRSTLLPLCLAASAALALSCSGGSDGKDGNDGPSGLNALASTAIVEAGENCPNGGTRLDLGQDKNGNGVLDADEITSTQFICNGVAGHDGQPGPQGNPGVSSTVSAAVEPKGANCPDGGIRITVTTGTSSKDSYICNGSDGESGAPGAAGSSSTVSAAVEPKGENCPDGGIRVTVTTGESSKISYVCNGEAGQGGNPGEDGANGHNSLVVTSDYEGDECESGKGIRIDVGTDLNDDGTLQETEISSTRYVCNGVDPEVKGCALEGENYCSELATLRENNRKFCEPVSGDCVECLVDEDCAEGTEYCVFHACQPYCGDGIVNNGEACDPKADISQWTKKTCGELVEGQEGTLKCNADCTPDNSDCHDVCGDNIVGPTEDCEPGVDRERWTAKGDCNSYASTSQAVHEFWWACTDTTDYWERCDDQVADLLRIIGGSMPCSTESTSDAEACHYPWNPFSESLFSDEDCVIDYNECSWTVSIILNSRLFHSTLCQGHY